MFLLGGGDSGGADGCGGCEQHLYEPTGSRTKTEWRRVGEGCGDYEMVQDYSFVGENAGSFAKQTVTIHDDVKLSRNPTGCLVMGCLSLTVVVLLFFIPWNDALSTTTTPFPMFDCNTGFANWQEAWPSDKQEWCCQNKGKACPATSVAGFDCSAGFQADWPQEKKDWCCANSGMGCAQTTPGAYDCDAGFANWQAGWSQGKKDWCCLNVGKGCQAPSPTDYDCSAGFANWAASWAPEKKQWCCAHYGRGCVPTSTAYMPTTITKATTWVLVAVPIDGSVSLPYDCEADFANWQAAWTPEKKTWCCYNKEKGCDGGVAQQQYDCSAGYANWQAGWSPAKTQWCCVKEGKGCPLTTVFDCTSGTEWVAYWGASKKHYCCQNAQIGC